VRPVSRQEIPQHCARPLHRALGERRGTWCSQPGHLHAGVDSGSIGAILQLPLIGQRGQNYMGKGGVKKLQEN
jgi:hypothetical protein